MVKKESTAPAKGHNADQAKKDFVKKFNTLQDKIDKIKEEQKDLLNDAKNQGHLKTSIKKAAAILRMGAEQWQAKKEVQDETNYIIQLFADSDGQYSFLKGQEEEEKAA